MAKAKKGSKATTSNDKAKADSKGQQAAKRAAKASTTAVTVLSAYSRQHITAISYKGVDIANPNSKTPFLQALRIAAIAAGNAPANGTEVPTDTFARARACFAVSGGFSYAADKAKTMASAKSEIRAYTLHEFVQRKHTPRVGNVDACADYARLLWAGKGTAKLANGQKVPTETVIGNAIKLVAPIE